MRQSKRDIIVLSGFSSSGKDSLARQLEKNGYKFIISTSSRPMRDYESQGDPYHFVSKTRFEEMIESDSFINYRAYHTLVDNKPSTWYYGTAKDSVDSMDSPHVIVMDIVGLRDFKACFGNRVLGFFVSCDDHIRKQRCITRGDYDETEFRRRLEDDKKRFSQEVIDKEVDYVIESTNIKDNLKSILEIIEYENKGNN